MNTLDNRPAKDARGLPADQRYVIYKWLTSNSFLLPVLIPDATVIDASIDDSIDAIEAKMPPDAACFHFHINCTVTSRFPSSRPTLVEYLRDRRIRPINADLVDISKRTVQQRCAELGLHTTAARQDGDPDELIVIKTDLNFGGDSEWALSADDRAGLGIGKGSQMIYRPDHYKVVPRREVEEWWWTDPALALERYVNNRDNRWYRAVMLFSHIVLRELVNPAQIKKVSQSIKTGEWNISAEGSTLSSSDDSYPALMVRDLVRFARAFSMDFGAVDIVVNDAGEAHIIDVNSTPALNSAQPNLMNYLRGALES